MEINIEFLINYQNNNVQTLKSSTPLRGTLFLLLIYSSILLGKSFYFYIREANVSKSKVNKRDSLTDLNKQTENEGKLMNLARLSCLCK